MTRHFFRYAFITSAILLPLSASAATTNLLDAQGALSAPDREAIESAIKVTEGRTGLDILIVVRKTAEATTRNNIGKDVSEAFGGSIPKKSLAMVLTLSGRTIAFVPSSDLHALLSGPDVRKLISRAMEAPLVRGHVSEALRTGLGSLTAIVLREQGPVAQGAVSQGPAELSVVVTPVQKRSIPRGATRVAMLQLTFTASCAEPVTVHSLTVQHIGLGLWSDFAGIYALQNARRVSGVTQLSGEGDAVLRFRGVVIPACGTLDVVIAADIAADAQTGGLHGLRIAGAQALETTDARIAVEQQGADMAATVIPAPDSGLEVAVTAPKQTLRYGKNRILGTVTLRARGSDGIAVSAITLTNKGTANDENLRNVHLEFQGKSISGNALLQGGKVVLALSSPLAIRSRGSVRLTLRGDVVSGTYRTVDFRVESAGDIAATVDRPGLAE